MVRKRILFVGMTLSSHLAGWLDLLRATDWQVFLLGIDYSGVGASLGEWRWIRSARDADQLPPGTIGVLRNDHLLRDARSQWLQVAGLTSNEAKLYRGQTTLEELLIAVQWIRPDVVHALELQRAGYLCLAGKRALGRAFPCWGVFNWGSDIYLYQLDPEHRVLLSEMLARCDFVAAECERDRALMQALGLSSAKPAVVLPASGGYPDDELPLDQDFAKPSARRLLVVKGQTNFAGRGVSALAAILLAKEHLATFEIRVRSANAAIEEAVQAIARTTQLDIAVERLVPSRKAALARMAEARVLLAVGISDGISTTALEAMALGAFPIQTSTSCLDEWVKDGHSGFIVPPHDTALIAAALVRAVEDDDLVDRAALANRRTVEQRWNRTRNAAQALAFYELVLGYAAEGIARPALS